MLSNHEGGPSFGGTPAARSDLTRLLTLRFGELKVNPMGDRYTPTKITHCGLEMEKIGDGPMVISQRDNVEQLYPLNLPSRRWANRCNETEPSFPDDFRKLPGQPSRAGVSSRPDISARLGDPSERVGNLKTMDLHVIDRLVSYMEDVVDMSTTNFPGAIDAAELQLGVVADGSMITL